MSVDVSRPDPWIHHNLTARGIRFHVAPAGPETPARVGPPTLLAHGFPECWWIWCHVIPALMQVGHRMAALDLCGFGDSDRPPLGYGLVTLAQDLAVVARPLGHEYTVVVGTGFGGQIAWALPHLAPDLTTAIVPVGAPHPLALRSLRTRALFGLALQYASLRIPGLAERRLRSRSALEGLLRSWTGPYMCEALAEEAPYYAELLSRPDAAHNALELLRNLVLSRTETAALDKPAAVSVLPVQGELDPVQPAQAHVCDTHHVVGNLCQVTVYRSGHFPQEEIPAEFVRASLPFLADAAPPASA